MHDTKAATNQVVGTQILIIEDDAALLRGLSDNFDAAGYAVNTATDGQVGLAAVLSQRPDLVILDIMLPSINGFDLCRRIRSEKLTMPVLMLTAKGQEAEIVRGLESGADDYVTKPFGIRELLARVNNLLRRGDVQAQTKIDFGDVSLDRAAHTLRVKGKRVPLTTKEYRLLDLFVVNPHRALTRTEIMNRVWGRSVIVSSRSVDRCVATLRSKIEPAPAQPRFIHTVRDVGYRFEPKLENDRE
jgi:DNA-binding response OmpR family regulator